MCILHSPLGWSYLKALYHVCAAGVRGVEGGGGWGGAVRVLALVQRGSQAAARHQTRRHLHVLPALQRRDTQTRQVRQCQGW